MGGTAGAGEFECIQEWQRDIPLGPTKYDTFQYGFAIRDVEQTASTGLDGSEGAWAPSVPLLTEGTAPAIVQEYTATVTAAPRAPVCFGERHISVLSAFSPPTLPAEILFRESVLRTQVIGT